MGKTISGTRDDRALMRAICRQDRSALDELYDRHVGLVYAVCMRVLGCPSDAEDAMIETFWQAWTKPEQYDELRGGVSTYLAMIARTRAIDLMRSRISESAKKDRAKVLEGANPAHHSPPPDAELIQVTQENHNVVHEAIESLTSEQQEAIRMAFYEGKSHRQIAETLQTPVGTIKSRLRQGLIQLREYFRNTDEEGQFP